MTVNSFCRFQRLVISYVNDRFVFRLKLSNDIFARWEYNPTENSDNLSIFWRNNPKSTDDSHDEHNSPTFTGTDLTRCETYLQSRRVPTVTGCLAVIKQYLLEVKNVFMHKLIKVGDKYIGE